MDNYHPVTGKTYGLFGDEEATKAYYSRVKILTDELLQKYSDSEPQLLEYIQGTSRKNHLSLRRKIHRPGDKLSCLLNRLHDSLSIYTPGADDHIRSMPVYKYLTDNTIMTNRDQYHLYMIEIELVNRIYRQKFQHSNYKIALLPYCLSESPADCKATPDEIDQVCRKCRKSCYIHLASSLLEEKNIHPYILSRGNLKPLFRKLGSQYGTIGVLGIACIAELVAGMRLCMKAGLPVVGIPLNANRCPRWMGDFHENSVDMEELSELVYSR